MKKVELEQEVRQLKQQLKQYEQRNYVDVEIEKHRTGYIHIPFSWGGLFRSLCVIGSGLLSLLCLYAVVFFWDYFNIWNLFKPSDEINLALVSTEQLFFLYPLFVWWFSVWLVAFMIVIWCNGGWEDCDFDGLVFALVFGSVVALVVGLFVGLVFALVVGLVFALVFGSVFALVVGSVVAITES